MKWIRCSERLPVKEGRYFTYVNEHKQKDLAYFSLREKGWETGFASDDIDNIRRPQYTVIEWLDEADNTDEEKAFEAARETTVPTVTFTDFLPRNQIKYFSFEDYLKSKQK